MSSVPDKQKSVKYRDAKPDPMPVRLENIPQAIRDIPHWGFWQWERDGKKWTKPCVNADGGHIQKNNPKHWGPFDRAYETYSESKIVDGLGFTLGNGTPFVIIDLDNCRCPETGEVTEWATDAVNLFDSYSELSPSGEGLKIWILGQLPDGDWRTTSKCRRYEVFARGAYLTVTGHVYDGHSAGRRADSELLQFLTAYMRRDEPASTEKSPASHIAKDPSETLELAAEAIKHIDPGCDYSQWLHIGMSLTEFGEAGFQLWNGWSKGGSSYPGESVLRDKWKSFKRDGGVTVRTLFYLAKQAGFQFPKAEGIGVTRGQTDVANAQRLIDEYGDRLRYVHEWHRWLYFDGQRWINNQTQVENLVQQSAKKLWPEIGPAIERHKLERDAIGKLNTFVKQSNNRRGLADTLRTAEADQRVAISYRDLDSHPTLLNCRNGTLNIDTGELSPHSSDQMLTQMANVDFDPNDSCPHWLNTLDLVFDGDLALFSYVQELIGYTLAGGNPSAILPIFHGSGNNGKSTMWLTIVGLLGDYAMVGNREMILGSRTEHQTIFADLYKKRLVAVAEPEEGSSLKEAEVKRLTGSDNIRARRMREDHWEFAPTHTLWIASNHKPKVNGNDEGIWRRLKLIPFEVDLSKVTTPKIDFHLWLLNNEAAGILNWAVRGYQRWRQRGGKFDEPEIVKMATADYRAAEDVWGQWIGAYCETGSEFEERAETLYAKYTDTGGRKIYKAFIAEIKTRGFDSYIPTSGENRKKTVVIGLRIPPIFESIAD